MFEQQAAQDDRQGREHEQIRQPTIGAARLLEHGAGQIDEQITREVHDYRGQRSELNDGSERRARIGLMEQRGREAQVGRRRDRDEFSEALDQAHDCGEPQGHG